MFALSLDGAAETGARFQSLPSTVQVALSTKASELAERLRAHVTDDKLSGQVLQARTGALRASIGAEVQLNDDGFQARVFSSGDVKYAAIQELGGRTAPHEIAPVKAKALAFLIGGRKVFARIVHHPGSTIPARSYLQSSLDDFADLIPAELNAVVTAALTD